jgi:hypothetical protein
VSTKANNFKPSSGSSDSSDSSESEESLTGLALMANPGVIEQVNQKQSRKGI